MRSKTDKSFLYWYSIENLMFRFEKRKENEGYQVLS